ncbi:MAG: hypothetical protein JJU20_10695 [Opitutales bacterium]|nr:hypothetical protein [Opitutales bacterium]
MTKIPLIHITDLYHPPQDPDDHFDLATIYGLPELDLKAVLLDATLAFLTGHPGKDHPRDPGFVPITQLNAITGRAVPAAVGPQSPLKSIDDDASDRPPSEQAAIHLLLDVLRQSRSSVKISVVGSLRILSAAFNREPDLVRKKTSAVLLNAGASIQRDDEWNVMLDQYAWKCLFQSGLPVHWYPCTGPNGPFGWSATNTFWHAPHKQLLPELTQKLRAWFHYAYTGNSRGDCIRVLNELGAGTSWNTMLHEIRSFWSTASLVMAANRVLAKTEQGWRFVPKSEAMNCTERHDWQIEPVEIIQLPGGMVDWKPAKDPKETSFHLFKRSKDPHHDAMAEALVALLRTLGRDS